MNNISGLSKDKLKLGFKLNTIQQCLQKCFKNNVLVGHSVTEDLNSLLYYHDRDKCEDLAEFYVDRNNQPYGLKTLAASLLDVTNFQTNAHCPLQDARITRKLHIKN